MDKLENIQAKAVSHIMESFEKKINPICALDMGLGKTRVACRIIHNIKDMSNEYRILLVIKTSNYEDPWIKELLFTNCIITQNKTINKNISRKYTNCIYMQGKAREMFLNINSNIYNLPKENIYIVPYDTLRIDIENNRYDLSLCYDLIIFDELQLIMNTKRETKGLLTLSKLKAKNKLALSGTPGQNTKLESGLMYIFLNSQTKLKYYISLREEIESIVCSDMLKKMKKEEIEKIVPFKAKILLSGNKDCIKYNALYFYNADKSHFKKNAIILSLPIDKDHYTKAMDFYGTNNHIYIPKKLMYLSSPSSVYYYNYKDSKQPYCTKEKAVEIILNHMGNGEKAIIFSRYKEVIYSYYELCRRIGYSAVIITGEDKGKSLQRKLLLFKNSDNFKVLLTTTQKSSEGFNFDFANHVIVLEFWWNPQKIIQAMSRIDRISQNKDIYIYLLCYNRLIGKKNEEGKIVFELGIIEEDKMYFDKMQDKIKDTNSFLEELYNENRIYYPESLTLKQLPELIEFNNLDTIENDLSEFLTQYHRKINIPEIETENAGSHLTETANLIIDKIKNYRYVSNILLMYPWRIINPEIQQYLWNHYQYLNRTAGYRIKDRITQKIEKFIEKPIIYDLNYPFMFIKYYYIKMNLNNEIIWHKIFFALGKRENGLYHVLAPQFGPFISTPNDLIDFILNYKFTAISTIIRDSAIKFFSSPLWGKKIISSIIESLTSIYGYILLYSAHENLGRELNNFEISNIEALFSQQKKSDAIEKVNEYKELANNAGGKVFYIGILNKIKRGLSPLYRYPPVSRSIIGTTNLIDILGLIIQTIIENKIFVNYNDAMRYIVIAANEILESGDDLIPNWKILTKPIYPIL